MAAGRVGTALAREECKGFPLVYTYFFSERNHILRFDNNAHYSLENRSTRKKYNNENNNHPLLKT